MAASRSIERMARPAGLILDYGNVLSRPQDQTCMDEAARRLGTDAAAFRAAYWRHRPAYDADLPAARYWQRVADAVRPGALAPDELEWLIATDVASWSVQHDEVWALAARFRAAGGRAAFLSNSGPEVMARVRADHPLETCFDAVVISCEVGLSKPDPRIFRLCLERLGLPAPDVLFVDDRADNVEGAAAVGLQTLQFDGPDALARLQALVE
jgi:putative hydrolase of the HAD superfamily